MQCIFVDGGWSSKGTTDKMAATATIQATKQMHMYIFNIQSISMYIARVY